MYATDAVVKRQSPAQEMADMVFNQFTDDEQIEIAKDFLNLLNEKRQSRYESLVAESKELSVRAERIEIGSKLISI